MNTPAMRLVGGSVAGPDGELEPLDVVIEHGRIAALELPGHDHGEAIDTIDVTGDIVAPGFIDIQINGGWGHDFTATPTSIGIVGQALPSTGVTAFVPTIISCSAERRHAALAAISSVDRGRGAVPLGLHFEGPAISPARPGAHDPRWIGPIPAEELTTWTRDRGVIIVTLAPEGDGALDVIRTLTSHGVVVSTGHTECTPEQFADARAAGASMVTHLFNAMVPFSHRAPGPIGATLADPTGVVAGVICDGIHAHPVAVRMAWRALGPGGIVLITDAMAALGLDTTTAELGDDTVTVGDDGVRNAAGVLAGSNLPLDQAVRNLVEYTGCSPVQAIRTVTAGPAELLRLDDRGRVDVGARADLVVLDQQLQIRRTIVEGHTVWKS